MKTKLLILFITISYISITCSKVKDELINEVPKNVIRTKIDSTLYPQIIDRFPDWTSAIIRYPVLFSDTIQNRIVLIDSSEVFLTFVAENAGYRNTIGWYSYKIGNPPLKIEDVNIQIIFPNASGKEEGGELLQGDMIQLGNKKISKGTVIGFFLIANGWNDGIINYNNLTYYTDLFLNPSHYQHHIIFKEINGKNIILGFEDMEYEKSDKDYNDLLFIISDNKDGFESIYFDLNKIPLL